MSERDSVEVWALLIEIIEDNEGCADFVAECILSQLDEGDEMADELIQFIKRSN